MPLKGSPMKKLLLSACLLGLSMPSFAAITATVQEQNAVKIVRSIYRLQNVRDYLVNFKSLDPVTVDLNDSIQLLDQTRQELVASLPGLTKDETASSGASNASFTLGLIVTDLKSLEAELKKKNKLTTTIQGRLTDVYDLYKEISE